MLLDVVFDLRLWLEYNKTQNQPNWTNQPNMFHVFITDTDVIE